MKTQQSLLYEIAPAVKGKKDDKKCLTKMTVIHISYSLYNSSSFVKIVYFGIFTFEKKIWGGKLTQNPLFQTWQIEWRYFHQNQTKS